MPFILIMLALAFFAGGLPAVVAICAVIPIVLIIVALPDFFNGSTSSSEEHWPDS